LNNRLLAAREELRIQGFLRLALESTPPSEGVPAPIGAWRRYADYRVLYEFDYQDPSDGQSLIGTIPVSIDSGLRQSMTIVDEMTRWDNLHAPGLSVRGPFAIGGLSLLVFVSTTPPTGAVTVTRTFDGAAGAPAVSATWAAFLAAVGGEHPAKRHNKVTFPTFTKFRSVFKNAGSPISLGDWDKDGRADIYQTLALSVTPAITLPEVIDHLEISYSGKSFDRVAVAYLRATS
jgi:hypothetical protein